MVRLGMHVSRMLLPAAPYATRVRQPCSRSRMQHSPTILHEALLSCHSLPYRVWLTALNAAYISCTAHCTCCCLQFSVLSERGSPTGDHGCNTGSRHHCCFLTPGQPVDPGNLPAAAGSYHRQKQSCLHLSNRKHPP